MRRTDCGNFPSLELSPFVNSDKAYFRLSESQHATPVAVTVYIAA